ncbi:hypothetical protein [Pyxidicoccus sp. MSG2]|uniref:hypothetical protein n=1 Tax=Pyxidicoccus sp. MSG2 TaxID=2996790 RepID=UPI00226E7B4D|nr:hypothetical protein [Pyxidicoccus sp. MSG2]MCY1019381.1 hypothetical protein [Pyxidicoccus sp. MSG2]
MRARATGLLGAVLLAVAGPAWGAGAEDARADYLRTLERFEQGVGFSLERVFDSGLAAARALREGREGPPAPLPGFLVNDEDVLDLRPDPRFFLALAKRRGTDVDREFFSLLGRTYAYDGVSRLYHAPGGCDAFDHPELEPLYRNWTRFWATHPRAYTEAVDQEVAALEDTVARSTCACGDRESVEAGLERFLKSFPRSPVAPDVRARLEQVRAGTSDFRFRCQPG